MLAPWPPARYLQLVAFLCSLLAPSAALAADVDACLNAYEAGQRERKRGALIEAGERLLVCAGSECPAAISKDCLKWLAEVEQATPSIVVVATSQGEELSSVRVMLDDREIAATLDGSALSVNPGSHRLRFEAPGMTAISRKLVIREGDKQRRVEVDFEPRPPAEDKEAKADEGPDHTLAYVLAGAGGVGLMSFSYFAIKSHAERSDLDACKGSCAAEDVDRVRQHQLIADVSLGAGLALIGVAAYLYFSEPPERATETALGFDLNPRRRGATATLWGKF